MHRFIADVMVGKLARWMRVLGFDVLYSNTFDDDEIVRLAETQNRIILTRDRGFAARRMQARYLLVESDGYREQVRQVLHTFGLKDFKVFSRCVECNTPLAEVDREQVFEKVPHFVYLTQNRFAVCGGCGRVYWHGTHADQMRKRLPI
jgi:uncharacterized protein with PIN domain